MVAAVVLAAGASTRYGEPKQRVFLPQVLERVRAAPVDEIVVVLGAHHVECDAPTVRCDEWERGPGASLRCGLAALAADVERAVVVLADGPALAPAAIERILGVDAEIVAASYAGSRGHPVAIRRSAWGRVPDEGARVLAAMLVPCDDLGAPGDVDFRR